MPPTAPPDAVTVSADSTKSWAGNTTVPPWLHSIVNTKSSVGTMGCVLVTKFSLNTMSSPVELTIETSLSPSAIVRTPPTGS